ncbi:MAG: 2-iminoacetate synthase ThiH [Verrucomicrobiota bacterium]
MSFVESFNRLDEDRSPLLDRFVGLLEPKSDAELEAMARESRALTQKNFGRAMRLFAPLYLSNECVNNCKYCGFSRDNPILRVTLSPDQVEREARHLALEGFRHILLVAGEHPKFVSDGYVEECIRRIRPFIPTIALEIGPTERPEYERMVEVGAEGLVVYQETYERPAYKEMHTAGPKRRFDWRLECPERAYDAGFRRIGIGALFGLADWRTEALGMAAHLEYLYRHCWKATYTVSLPRLRPAAGEFQPRYGFTDRDMVQLICALRMTFHQVGIVLSTREPQDLRDSVIHLGVTSMSAGSHTEPGGYTGEGKEDLHLTVKGRRVELNGNAPEGESACATEQFGIADQRSAKEVAAMLERNGFEPVWKDWEQLVQ